MTDGSTQRRPVNPTLGNDMLEYQIYGWSWLPWHHRHVDQEFGITDNYAGWLCIQLKWRTTND